MKMGTTASPSHYDATAGYALQSAKLRRPAGFKISWIGFDGKGKTSALEMVGLKDTGEPDEVNEAPSPKHSRPTRPPCRRCSPSECVRSPDTMEKKMKHALAAGLVLIFSLLGPNSGKAQPMTTETSTTKILAIGTINPGVDPAQVFAILPHEVRDTVDLYLNGKIDQWYSQQERRGVVFILNVTDTAAAHDMLEKLPLGQAHLMSFELIPIGPLNPLRQLQGMKSNP